MAGAVGSATGIGNGRASIGASFNTITGSVRCYAAGRYTKPAFAGEVADYSSSRAVHPHSGGARLNPKPAIYKRTRLPGAFFGTHAGWRNNRIVRTIAVPAHSDDCSTSLLGTRIKRLP